MKKFFILTALIFLLALTSCSKINDKNISKIKTGMSRTQIVAILGQPDDELDRITQSICYWFNGADSLTNAVEKAEKGKEIRYICVIFGYEAPVNESYALKIEDGVIDKEWTK